MRLPLFLALAFCALPIQADNEQNTRLRTTIEQWMATMEKLQKEEQRWSRERQVLIDNEEGLKSELEQVEADIAAVKARIAKADTESQEHLEQKQRYDQARKVFADQLAPLEQEALKIAPLLPEFFLKESSRLQTAILQLKKNSSAPEKPGPNQRMAPVVQILTEAERFNQKIWTTSEVITVKGSEKNMKVVYLGLALSFATDTDGTVAMKGTPSPNGWSYAPLDAGEATEVLQLIGAADQSGESVIVTLPITISEIPKK